MVVCLAQCVLRRDFMAEKEENLICDEMSEKIIDAAQSIASAEGIHEINVRKILKKLNITNRVFYNRFHNIGEVLNIC